MENKSIAQDNFELLEKFLEMIIVINNATENTISSYRTDLILLAKFLSPVLLRNANFKNLEQYLLALSQQKYSASSITRKIITFRQFYKFLYLEKIIYNNPTLNIELPKQPRKIPKYLTAEEINKLFTTLKNDEHPNSIRTYTILESLYASGMRISELINLKLIDVKPLINPLNNKQYIIIMGKGRKERMVPFSKLAINALKEYLKTHAEQSKWLFPGDSRGTKPRNQEQQGEILKTKQMKPKQDNHITRQRLGQIFKELALKAGIPPERLSPHVVRHSFATHLLNNGTDIKIIQDLLGHSSIATTEIYTHIPTEALRDSILKNHPLANKSLKLKMPLKT